MSNKKTVKDIAVVCDKVAAYELSLIKTYAALIYGHDLWKVIGYPSSDAFRQAVKRKSVPVPTFKRQGYRMRFARSHDVAVWLASMDYQ